MRIGLSLLSMLVAVAAMAYPREIEADSIYSAQLKQQLHYSVVLPSDYEQGKPYKIMYMLHGTGDNCSFWLDWCAAADQMDRLVTKGEIDPIIMVIPDGFVSYYSDAYDGSFPYESFFINELMPAVEKKYSVPDDRRYRCLMGYSMGGFGVVSMGIHNIEKFGTLYSLSLSIRTDEQYMTESPQDKWNDQWGRTFGAVDSIGESRLTSWYKLHSPYHVLEAVDPEKLKDTRLIFDIGDKDWLETGCEPLHRMMLRRGVKHEWIVSEGNHNFMFWRTHLPDVLRAFSPASEPGVQKPSAKDPGQVIIGGGYRLYLPDGNALSNRRYATIYVRGDGDANLTDKLAEMMLKTNDSLAIAPVAFCFINPKTDINTVVARVESENDVVRPTQRMRALIDVAQPIKGVAASLAEDNLFDAIALMCPQGTIDDAAPLSAQLAGYKRYPRLWIWTTADDACYDLPSELHLSLRQAQLTHEFRVSPRPDIASIIAHLNTRMHGGW